MDLGDELRKKSNDFGQIYFSVAAMLHATADRFTKQEFFKIKEGQMIVRKIGRSWEFQFL